MPNFKLQIFSQYWSHKCDMDNAKYGSGQKQWHVIHPNSIVLPKQSLCKTMSFYNHTRSIWNLEKLTQDLGAMWQSKIALFSLNRVAPKSQISRLNRCTTRSNKPELANSQQGYNVLLIEMYGFFGFRASYHTCTHTAKLWWWGCSKILRQHRDYLYWTKQSRNLKSIREHDDIPQEYKSSLPEPLQIHHWFTRRLTCFWCLVPSLLLRSNLVRGLDISSWQFTTEGDEGKKVKEQRERIDTIDRTKKDPETNKSNLTALHATKEQTILIAFHLFLSIPHHCLHIVSQGRLDSIHDSPISQIRSIHLKPGETIP